MFCIRSARFSVSEETEECPGQRRSATEKPERESRVGDSSTVGKRPHSSMSALECKEKGNTLYKAGKYQEAVEAYTEAIEADPDDHTFLGNRSAALLMLKKYDQAIADCMKATQLDPTYVKAYIRASKCHSQQAKIYEAKSVLSECLAKIPDCPEAVKEMETLTQLENDLSAAKEHLGEPCYLPWRALEDAWYSRNVLCC